MSGPRHVSEVLPGVLQIITHNALRYHLSRASDPMLGADAMLESARLAEAIFKGAVDAGILCPAVEAA